MKYLTVTCLTIFLLSSARPAYFEFRQAGKTSIPPSME